MTSAAHPTRNGRKTAVAGGRPAAREPRAEKLARAYREALEQQAATADILRALSRSATDPQPVFDAIVEHAHRLCGAVFSIVYRYDGARMDVVANKQISAKATQALRKLYPAPPRRDHIVGRAILEGRPMHSEDCQADARFPANHPSANPFSRLNPFRAGLVIPLARTGAVVGALAVGRPDARPFTRKEIGLLRTFADQAVIAIENARLFNETTETLEHQRASGDILRIVSRSVTDARPVFDAILAAARRLFEDFDATVWMAERNELVAVARGGPTVGRGIGQRVPIDPAHVAGIVVLGRKPLAVSDVSRASELPAAARKWLRENGRHAVLWAPLLRDEVAIGAVSVSRTHPFPFTQKHVALLQNFADQAAIAIRNAEYFREIQARNAELRQALEFQAAGGEILSAITASVADTRPVFDAIVANLRRLLGTDYAAVTLLEDGQLELAAFEGGAGSELVKEAFPRPLAGEGHLTARAILRQRVQHVAPIVGNPEAPPETEKFSRLLGYDAAVAAPMIRGGEVIGAIAAARKGATPFDERQLALIKAFADQAVIAIENARLFNETKEALERQTATGDILRVIAGTPTDTQPVFDAIVGNAQRIIRAKSAVLLLRRAQEFFVAAYSIPGVVMPAELAAVPLDRSSNFPSRVILDRHVLHIQDWEADDIPEHEKAVARALGFGSGVLVPLLRKGEGIGALVVSRAAKGAFSEKEIALLTSFADQAVIAIENVRLFKETKEALEQQTATAGVLQVISRSTFDLDSVFGALVENAARLCGAQTGMIFRREGATIRLDAAYGASERFVQYVGEHGIPLDRGSVTARAALEGRTVHVLDVTTDADYTYGGQPLEAYRTIVGVPLRRNGETIGVFTMWRHHVEAFTPRQIALVETFADQAVIAIENVRLFNETKEALERQTATSDILGVISSSPTDTAPVFRIILEKAAQLCGAELALYWRYEGGNSFRALEFKGPRAEFARWVTQQAHEFGPPFFRQEGPWRPVQTADVRETEPYRRGDPVWTKVVELENVRTLLMVPLVRDQRLVGSIAIYRQEVRPFAAKQIELVETFAKQAVIAIENVRLFDETKEALARQTATAEILRVISRSPGDVQPVFQAIVSSAHRLLSCQRVAVLIRSEGHFDAAAWFDSRPDARAPMLSAIMQVPIDPAENFPSRVFVEKRMLHLPDWSKVALTPHEQRVYEEHGWRASLMVPLMRDETCFGVLTFLRSAPVAFTDNEIALGQSFADQAVIAIENVRLFNETKEALERQTATAEILQVISASPTDIQPVFDIIAERAMKLCEADNSVVSRVEGGRINLVATHAIDAEGMQALRKAFPMSPDDETATARVARSGEMVQIEDVISDPLYAQKAGAAAMRYRACLAVPMRRGDQVLGVVFVGRATPGRFGDKQLLLLRTFADQAVIAIENVRLFNETKEALERQTATAEILRVISASPGDTAPVFRAILDTGLRLCEADHGASFSFDGEAFHALAGTDHIRDKRIMTRIAPGTQTPLRRVGLEKRTVHTTDLLNDCRFRPPDEYRQESMRSALAVPMLKDGELVGALAFHKRKVRPFTERQIALIETFADQAVIAIENVRLFKELQARTEALTKSVGQLTALGEVGQAVGSTLEVENVLKLIVAHAVRLTGLDAGVIYEHDPALATFELRASENFDPQSVAGLRDAGIRLGEGAVGRAVQSGEPVQITDTHAAGYPARLRELLDAQSFRSILAVPLAREGQVIGALMVLRKLPGEFAPEVVELLRTFSSQSAIAIQNARLYREIEDKGRQLETASRHKSQFLASMSHELRTPLNAMLGFNEMLLDNLYGEVPEAMKEPLTDMQTSGKHLLRLINNVLDLAKIEAGRMELTLSDYSVHDTVASVQTTLRPLAADKGLDFVATVPEDIPLAYGDAGRLTQCLMNLAGNSLKFTKQGRVSISVLHENGLLRYSVADTGIGIPPEKIGSLFTEFKQSDATIASEYGGTGLGLSITRKFIEMHGGRIWVESELGKGSQFIFEVPLRVNP